MNVGTTVEFDYTDAKGTKKQGRRGTIEVVRDTADGVKLYTMLTPDGYRCFNSSKMENVCPIPDGWESIG